MESIIKHVAGKEEDILVHRKLRLAFQRKRDANIKKMQEMALEDDEEIVPKRIGHKGKHKQAKGDYDSDEEVDSEEEEEEVQFLCTMYNG